MRLYSMAYVRGGGMLKMKEGDVPFVNSAVNVNDEDWDDAILKR